MTVFANVILPVILVAGVGFVVSKRFTVDIDSVNKVSLYAFTPALAYSTVVTTRVSASESGRLAAAYLLATVAAAVIAFLAAHTLAGGTRSVVVGCTIIGNNGNFGLPIALLAFGQAGLDQALVIFITSLLVNFSVGPALLGAGGGLWPGIRRVLLLPVTWALAAALVVRASGVTTPTPVMNAVDILAAAAVPLVLLALGLQLGQSTAVHLTRPVLLSVALRATVTPATAYAAGLVLGLSGLALHSLVLACTMPTAVNAYLLAREFSDDPATAASAVALSTVVSVPLIMVLLTVLPTP
ncbi:MAG: AEC family transporter [Actinomycetales bacterium]